MTPAIARSLALALADDELVLGYRESEWTGVAPMLEEDVALSSIAQDEIGHARALYLVCASLDARGGESADVDAARADALAFDRPPEGFRHARLCERPRGDWGEEIAKRALYELADAVRLEALVGHVVDGARPAPAEGVARGGLPPRARPGLARPAGRRRATAGCGCRPGSTRSGPTRSGCSSRSSTRTRCSRRGILPVPSSILCTTFEAVALEELASRGLTVPEDVAPLHGGRRGRHTRGASPPSTPR